jgi:hypothetical protein
VLLAIAQGEAVIGVPNAWAKDYITKRLAPFVVEVLARLLNEQSLNITFVTPDTVRTTTPAIGINPRVKDDKQAHRQLALG